MTVANIEVWLVDVDRAGGALHRLAAAHDLILPEDKAHYASLDSAEQQRRLAARVALRLVIWRTTSELTAWQPFKISPTGKPSLGAAGPAFSLAHTGSHALFAVSRAGAVGVDLETVRPITLSAARRQSIETAGALLAPRTPLVETPHDRRFVQAWTRIEALAKLKGTGAAATLAALTLRQPGADRTAIANAVADTLAQAPSGPKLEISELHLPPIYTAALVAAIACEKGATIAPVIVMPNDERHLLQAFLV